MKRTHLGTAIGATAASVALGLTLTGTGTAAAPDPAPFCSGGAFTQSNTSPAAIPDNNASGVSRSITVTGQAGTVRDVDAITNIIHPVNGEVQIDLSHTPAGGATKTVRLITSIIPNRNGTNGFNGTRWDDSALAVVSAQNWQTVNEPKLNLVPEGAMAAFIGDDPNGTWTLTVSDRGAMDAGTLNSWTLDVKTSTQSSPIASQNFVGTGDPIPDATGPSAPGVLTKTIAVSGLPSYLTDLNLNTQITHQFGPDLEITLTSPAGTTVFVSRRRGGGSMASLTTKFEDQADTLLTTAPDPPSGATYPPVIPEGAMGAFIGQNPNGTWTLTIKDIDAAGPTTGTLNGWNMDIAATSGCTPPPPGTGTPGGPTGPKLPLPKCTKVNLATTILGDRLGERGEILGVKVKLTNRTRKAGAKAAKAVFALPPGFTLPKQKGITLKKGKITVAFGAIRGGKSKTLKVKLRAKDGASFGLRTTSVAASALCGSKAKATLLKLKLAANA